MRKFAERQLLVASHNRGKQEEIEELLRPFSVEVLSAAKLLLPEPVETENTFLGNARIKAHASAKASGIVSLADDSGVCVDALGDAPGVYTADWAESSDGRDFAKAMTRTWLTLEEMSAPSPRIARFCCTLVLAWPDGHDEVFEGVMAGRIVWPMRGNLGHGYDPVFQPDGFDVTFGEMDRWQKNGISHRAAAFGKLVEGCFT